MLAESALHRNIVDSVVAHAWWKHRCVWPGDVGWARSWGGGVCWFFLSRCAAIARGAGG